MKTLILASHNQGKFREMSELFSPYGIELKSIKEYGLAEPVEDGETFKQNAYKKARAAAKQTGEVALGDDSGICIAALGGAPGIYSADWSEVENNKTRDFNKAMLRVQKELHGKGAIAPAQRKAFFFCCLCLCWPNGKARYFKGKVHGQIIKIQRGTLGFGYDPIFLPKGYEKTFGEMQQAEKQKISHRAVAFSKLIKKIKNYE